MNVLTLQVLTPQATVLAAAVDAVVAPLPDGWIGVLPGHAPFVARLMAGQIVFRAAGGERRLATLGGIIAVTGDSVTVLAGAAAPDRATGELEREVSQYAEHLVAAEKEAQKHFERVYHQLARAFDRRARGYT